jgi:response regulator RpfG family c-di-GMP phosphodiesterase
MDIEKAGSDNDELLFAEEDEQPTAREPIKGYWKILIVDDEEEVHNVTKMVLNDIVFKGKGIHFFHAYSGEESVKLIRENPDTAIILLDVVMEDDNSGLKVIKYIREVLKNQIVRIVIRTGQPGEAPEKKVIVDYDINDYREKTELTSQKLFSTVIASLRSYESLTTIESNRLGLEKIINASAKLLDIQRADKFAPDMLEEITAFFSSASDFNSNGISGFIADITGGEYRLIASSGLFNPELSSANSKDLLFVVEDRIKKLKTERTLYYFDTNRYICYFKTRNGFENVIFLQSNEKFIYADAYLIEILTSIISSIYENMLLTKEIEDTQKEILFTIGEVIETRSHETGNHVRRVAEYSKLLALKYGLPEDQAELIKQASPMHDVGKVGILDRILNKPAKLTEDEFEEIKTHTSRGYNIFKSSNRKLLKTAAIIALQHHERWDGSGYPNGISGEEIHIFGRITCLADVFDALGSDRVYKKAWKLVDILNYINAEKGKLFDPNLVDIFFENLDEILKIQETLQDSKEVK